MVSGQKTLLLPDGPDEPLPPASPTASRWRRWGLIGATVLVMIFACPLLASAALGLLEAVANPVAAVAPGEGENDSQATQLAATINALSTEVAAQQVAGLSSSDIETAVYLTLNAHTITPAALTEAAVQKTQSAFAAGGNYTNGRSCNHDFIEPHRYRASCCCDGYIHDHKPGHRTQPYTDNACTHQHPGSAKQYTYAY